MTAPRASEYAAAADRGQKKDGIVDIGRSKDQAGRGQTEWVQSGQVLKYEVDPHRQPK